MPTNPAPPGAALDPNALASFHTHLAQSRRVLALLGAGLSASSGLPTFRGAGGLWRTHDAVSLATPEAFARNPGRVWQFYNYRRHRALEVEPNAAHEALAELARRMEGFVALSQNVDGLSQRAGHPAGQLRLLHGTLFELQCSGRHCDYRETNFTDPVCPALAIPTEDVESSSSDETADAALTGPPRARGKRKSLDISNVSVPLPSLQPADLPHCPRCQTHLLRPGVVWFGEQLPRKVLQDVDAFLNQKDVLGKPAPIDLMLVVGTSAQVHPAAGYIEHARQRGARVCVVNMEANTTPLGDLDWVFQGDAAIVLPQLLGQDAHGGRPITSAG